MLFAFEQWFPFFLVRPTLKHFLEPFHHMLNDVKMIDDNVCFWQAELDRWAIRSAHMHTHRFDGIGIAEPFEERYDLFLFASRAHFKHATSFQIAEDRVITVPFAARELINTQKLRRAQRLLFIPAQSLALEFLEGHALETLLHKTWTDSGSGGDMRDGLGAGLLADRFSQACGRLASPAPRSILFRKGCSTAQAAKAAFEQDQFDAMPAQGNISFLSRSRIMDFYAQFLTMRAGCLCGYGYHLHPDRPSVEPFLAHNLQLVQV